ncbi:TetR/AcrR family transcriptional regulator [Mycolicibacterium tokaiense]|uniref:Transcriptional regulator n=1 Tax=Mycolicibacterium tokaiense TaxID=39695 RepID=A0A378TID3_9MYCO|nr:TetR/AcrR family transcriptional regulator [Mycolicibacterium tokaiense]BBY84922.1 TetR family transcriptional regulator [Mycolicibacterium tokaiense]STZ60572.1 transcriptional regulator [Mycolicibacterium tokaiense]
MSRADSAAATRRALLDHAAALLDSGGPAAVTLREVGARAGVTRGAPYGHFPDKEALLTAVATEGWQRLADAVHALRADPATTPIQTLRAALSCMITTSREHPHMYRLMFAAPADDLSEVGRAAQRFCDEFHAVVAAVFGDMEALRYEALFLTGTHGAAGLEASGLLSTGTAYADADALVDTLLELTVGEDLAKPTDP